MTYTKASFRRAWATGISGVAALVLSACGSTSSGAAASTAPAANASETVAAGDIPDTQVYVPFSPPGGVYTVSVPQGWAQSTVAGSTEFTDKYNSVQITSLTAPKSLDVASVTASEVPALKTSVAGFVLGKVTAVTTSSGPAVRITYRATSKANAVTGATVALAVERYDFAKNGREIALTLSGATGADNVDPWKKITDSFRWQP
jgi:hypothetical protein